MRHVERTKILLFVLDGSLDPYEKRSPLNDLNSLFEELYLYDKNFAKKPFLVALNKIDIDEAKYKENFELLKNHEKLRDTELVCISGKEAIGLEELSSKIRVIAEKITIMKKD